MRGLWLIDIPDLAWALPGPVLVKRRQTQIFTIINRPTSRDVIPTCGKTDTSRLFNDLIRTPTHETAPLMVQYDETARPSVVGGSSSAQLEREGKKCCKKTIGTVSATSGRSRKVYLTCPHLVRPDPDGCDRKRSKCASGAIDRLKEPCSTFEKLREGVGTHDSRGNWKSRVATTMIESIRVITSRTE